MSAIRDIRLEMPRVEGDRVTFSWSVEPASDLYQRTTFFLRFPSTVEPSAIPPRIWWTIAMLCLHGQWPLLRPCRIHLPVRLGPGENELWCRLLDAAINTLEAHSGGTNRARTIEIIETGEPIVSTRSLPDLGNCATAFSGGKDSLLQAGLLSELTADVLLVTTTSPMPPLHDHQTPRRRQVLREIVARRSNVTLIEVESDLRASWQNDFPPRVGYQVSVNELTDTFLYLSSLIAAGWAHGATHLFLASEAEVQENLEQDGVIVQHPHAMYSVVTQSAISALLAKVGLRYGSLISPLHSQQVQQLLWKRYGDLADLQYSCWRVGADQATCSSCSQCLRIAFAALAAGEMPQRMGIDLVRLVGTMQTWMPRPPRASMLPGDRVAAELHAQTVRTIVGTPLTRFVRAIATSGRLHTPRGLLAIARFHRLRRRLRGQEAGQPPAYRSAYVEQVDPLVREPIRAIYAAAFPVDDGARQRSMRERGERLTRWIVEPLAQSDAVPDEAQNVLVMGAE